MPHPLTARNQAAALSALFSSSVISDLAKKGSSPRFARLSRLCSLDASVDEPVGDYFDRAFAKLAASPLRDEYVFKHAIIKKILLGRHSLRTATVLSEFRVGTRKADLAIINGTSTVYEIKSDRDNLDRLEGQLAAYQKIFAQIFVVAAEQHVEKLRTKISAEIGILLLKKNGSLSTVRNSVNNIPQIDPMVLGASLRRKEAMSLLVATGRSLPTVPNTQIARVLQQLFAELTPEEAHHGMVSVMGKSRSALGLKKVLPELPSSLVPAVLSANFKNPEVRRLSNSVSTSMATALTWG